MSTLPKQQRSCMNLGRYQNREQDGADTHDGFLTELFPDVIFARKDTP